jgi:putative acetyltransferase
VTFTISIDDPRADDVCALLAAHLAFANEHTRIENIHALDVDGVVGPDIAFYSCRVDGRLVGVGALKQLDVTHAELKSMHTAAAARGKGVGRAMVEHLIAVARARGYTRVSLETGTPDAFAPARAMYASVGFVACGPFGDYAPTPDNTFMTLELR